MVNRPRLADTSFLAAIFKPSKNPLPVGLRKKKTTSFTGRKRSRVHAYNRMPAKSQRLLDMAGQREAYLKGEATLADARRLVRPRAESLGIVKPSSRTPTIYGGVNTDDVVQHVVSELSRAGKAHNASTIRLGVSMMTTPEMLATLRQNVAQLVADAGNPDMAVTMSDGKKRNPKWYR